MVGGRAARADVRDRVAASPGVFETLKYRLPMPVHAAASSQTAHDTVWSPLVSAVVSRMRTPTEESVFE
jgi:hypothetical protein